MLTIEDLARILETYPADGATRVAEFRLGEVRFDFNQAPAVMGVINLSPDSWYRESVVLSTQAAVERGRVLHAQGAKLVDIGAESSLAHARRMDGQTQQIHLVPIVKDLAAEHILVSVETYDPATSDACLNAGASVINLTGLDSKGEILHQVADHQAAVILCFVQGENVREVGDLDLGRDPTGHLYEFFARRIDAAARAGVQKIFVDPGLGFYYRNLQDSASRVRHQMQTFLQCFRLRTLGYPVCNALPHAFDYFREEVRCAEPFFAVLAALGKTDLFRTHEVQRVKAVLDTLAAF